jgi:hypothetical protein
MATLTAPWAIDARRTEEIPLAAAGTFRCTPDVAMAARLLGEESDHFSDVLIFPKLVDSLVPTPCTALMIASAIPAAKRSLQRLQNGK